MRKKKHRSKSVGVSRRVFLATAGTSAIAAMAGCSSSDNNVGENTSSTDEPRTTQSKTATETRSTSTRTITQEQSIITTKATTTATATTTQKPTPESTPTEQRTTIAPTPANTDTSTTETPTVTSSPSSAVGKWDEKALLPVVQSDAGSGVLDGKLYVYGGIKTDPGLDAVTRAFSYDPTDSPAGSWRRIEDLPQPLWGNCGVATDTALYSFGGAPQDGPYSGPPPSDAIFKYAPDSGWENLTATQGVRCPYRNWVMKGLYNPADGLIYCLGGGTAVTDRESATDHGDDKEVPGSYDENRIWTYDPETDQVSNPDLARMPTAKRWITVALVEVDGQQYIHAIGGLLGTTGPTDSNFRYDIEAGLWERMEPIPIQGIYATHSNPVISNQVYLTHGMVWESGSTIYRYKLTAHRYDPVTDTFDTELPRPQYLRGGASCGVIDETLYVVGGHLKRFDQDGLHDAVAYNEAFTPLS
jgi:N-acetylneuraminic acid mutarotase